MKKLFAVIVILICLIPFFPVPTQALEGEIFIDKVFTDRANSDVERDPYYSLSGEIRHDIGIVTTYAKANIYLDHSGFSVLTREYNFGTYVQVYKNITMRAGYILKEFPDNVHENLYLVGIGYRFGKSK